MARPKMADQPPLTQARLAAVLRYYPEIGFFQERQSENWYLGCYDGAGYLQMQIDGVRYRAHRLAWFYTYGVWPVTVDHINGIRDDNRIANLREATNTQNCRNSRLPVHNTSGFKGATKWRGRWAARIKVNKKVIHLGMFDTPELAHEAYCEAAKRLHGVFWNPG